VAKEKFDEAPLVALPKLLLILGGIFFAYGHLKLLVLNFRIIPVMY
jgi:hypothetical protein